MTDDDMSAHETGAGPELPGKPARAPGVSPMRSAARVLRRHGRIARGLGLIVLATMVGAAYIVGGPPAVAQPNSASDQTTRFGAAAPGATMAAAIDLSAQSSKTSDGSGSEVAPAAAPDAVSVDQSGADQSGTDQSGVAAAAAANQIIKTGQLSLEVADITDAISKSEAAISGPNGLGGSVDSSSQTGTGDQAFATLTFKVPVDKWDAAVAALRNIGGKVLSQQTGTTDVTATVIDLDARIDNLQKTETALQAIMTKATVIADVIAVEKELSLVQGQIEELTASRDSLKTQAAMSTLTVSYQLPAKTVTTQATQDWTLGNQIDIAGAALVRIGQGLATMGVWLMVVILPIGLVAGLLLAILYVLRRVTRRGRRSDDAAQI